MMAHAVNLVKRHSRDKLALTEKELKEAEKEQKDSKNSTSHADNSSVDEEGRCVTKE